MKRLRRHTLFSLAAITLILVPVAIYYRHSATWGPAEQVADTLKAIVTSTPLDRLSEEQLIKTLRSPAYRDLGIADMKVDIVRRDGELAWFAPNSKYTVGIRDDGAICWMVNGQRIEE